MTLKPGLCVCVCVYARVCACMWVCVCERERLCMQCCFTSGMLVSVLLHVSALLHSLAVEEKKQEEGWGRVPLPLRSDLRQL